MKMKFGRLFGSRAGLTWLVCVATGWAIPHATAGLAPGDVRWRFALPGLLPQPPVVAPDRTVYVAARSNNHQLHPDQETTVLVALSPEGVELWRRAFPGAIYSLPIRMPNGDVVVTPFGKAVYRVQPDGKDRGIVEVPFLVRGGVVTQGGDLVVLGEDRGDLPTQMKVRVLDAEGLTHAVWTISYDPDSDSARLASGVPAVVAADGALITLRADGGVRWTSLNDGTSQERTGIMGGPGNRVSGAVPGASDTLVGASPTGMAMLDASLNTLWELPGTGFNAPPVMGSEGMIYFGDEAGSVRAVSSDGTLRWQQSILSPVRSAAAVLQNGDVVVSGEDGQTVAFDAGGQVRWSQNLGGSVVGGLAATSGGDLLASLQEGELVCVVAGSPVAPKGWPVLGGDPSHSGRSGIPVAVPETPSLTRAVDQVDVQVSWKAAAGVRGYEIWSSTTPDLQQAHRALVSFNGSNQAWVTDSPRGVTNWFWLRGVNASEQGAFSKPLPVVPTLDLWRISVRAGLPEPGSVTMPYGPTWVRNQVIIAWTDSTTPPTTRVQAYSEFGSLQWERKVEGAFNSAPVVDGQDRIVIVTSTGISVLKANGSQVGTSPGVIDGFGVPAVGQDGVIHVPTSSLWRLTYRIGSESVTPIQVTNAPLSSVAVAGMLEVGPSGGVAMGGPGGFWVLPPAGGLATLQVPSLEATAVAPLPNGDWMVGTTFGLTRISSSGKGVWVNSLVRVGSPFGDRWHDNLAVDADGTTYAVGTTDIFAVDAKGPLKWRREFAGEAIGVGAPLLTADKRLLVPTVRGMLILNRQGELLDSLHFEHGEGTTPLLAASGRMFWFDGVVLRAVQVGTGADLAAIWPLPGRDVHRSSSLAASSGFPSPTANVQVEPGLGFNRVRWSVGDLVDRVVYRSTSSDFTTAQVIATLGPGVGGIDDTSAVPGQNATYWVVSRNALGEASSVAGPTVQTTTASLRARVSLSQQEGISTPASLTREGLIYVGTGDTSLHQLDLDLSNRWTLQLDVVRPELHGYFTGPILVNPSGNIVAATVVGTRVLSPVGVSRTLIPGWTASPLLLRDGGLVGSMNSTRLEVRSLDGLLTRIVSPLESGIVLPAVDAAGTLFRLTTTGVLQAIGQEGTVRWTRRINAQGAAGIAVAADGTVVLVAWDGSLQVLNGGDGSRRWSIPIGGARMSAPVLGMDAIYVKAEAESVPGQATDVIWICAELATGAIRWRRPASSLSDSAAAVAEDGTVYLPMRNELQAVDAATGATRWRLEISGTRVTAPVIHSDGTVVVASDREVVTIRGGAGPAASGWPMVRNDARNSGAQGGGGLVPVKLTPDAAVGGWILEAAGSLDPFIAVSSTDLQLWSPIAGTTVTHRHRISSTNATRFFQGVVP